MRPAPRSRQKQKTFVYGQLSGAMALMAGTWLGAVDASADYLVVAPHPDDDIITSAGVIYRARQSEIPVWVVYMTNGDVQGIQYGLTRQAEAVQAQALLGVDEDHMLFLGYPDQSLQGLASAQYKTTPFDSNNGSGTNRVGTSTHGERGLGRAPYNRIRTGSNSNGSNTGDNVRADLAHILSTYRPTDIFVTIVSDAHPDHANTNVLLRGALKLLPASSYNPTVHETVVWHDRDVWPLAPDPTTYFTEPVCNPDQSWWCQPAWDLRESLDVPLALQDTDVSQNPKARALALHVTQGGFTNSRSGFISTSLHKDQFFWTSRATGADKPPVPHAGFDQTVAIGDTVTLDATESWDPDGAALTYAWRQVEGSPSVALSDSSDAQPTFVARGTLGVVTRLAFELQVSDGVSTSVPDAVTVLIDGTLPVSDAGVEVDAGASDDAGSQADAGMDPDAAAENDAGATDASVAVDAAVTVDAGLEPDAALSDAGMQLDAGVQLDASTSSDAAADDASLVADADVASDAESADAAFEADASDASESEDAAPYVDAAQEAEAGASAGQPDAESVADSGDSGRSGDSGCSLSSGPSPATGVPGLLAWLPLLALVTRRRRTGARRKARS